MTIVEELRAKVSRDNRELLDRAADEIEKLTIEKGKCVEALEMQIKFLSKVLDIVERKQPESAPAGDSKKHFAPEDVRKMSPREVRENYAAIINSMKEWKL